MDTGVKIVLGVTFLLVLSGCRGTKNKNSTTDIPSTESSTSASNDGVRSVEDIYKSLPLFNLPLESDEDLILTFRKESPLETSGVRRLTDIGDVKSHYKGSAWIARLPKSGNGSFIIVLSSEKGQVIDLYSLSEELYPKDRLRLYSVEEVNEAKSLIIQTFVLSADHVVTVSKHLNRTLIEKLNYTTNTEGFFEELRNGKAITVAYDTYDGVNYFVETFIWDHNESGALIKKESKTQKYQIDNDGDLVKVYN